MDKIPKAIISGFPGSLTVEINSCLYGKYPWNKIDKE